MQSLADHPVAAPHIAGASPAPPVRLTPNLFASAFGIAGLAECWSAAATATPMPVWPADALWIVAAVVWIGTLAVYGYHVIATGRVRTELADPTFAPFLALASITPMLLGTVLAEYTRTAGVSVFVVFFVATVVLGGWLTGQWILSDTALQQWHPGYFLPTVAGGFIASTCCSQLGYDQWARVMFGYGAVSWLVLGSILLQRLFTQPALPPPLLPTMAIEMAPPVVAGAAWFLINDGRIDGVALGLAGYAILMAMVQLRLIPLYRTVPFGPGWWAFSFSYAAAFTVAIQWLSIEHASGQQPLTYALLIVVTVAIGVLAIRTVSALVHRRYLPRPVAAPAAHNLGATS